LIPGKGISGSGQRLLAVLGIGILVASAVPLALAGPQLVPASAAGEPRWLLGPFGGGIGLDGAAFFGFLIAAFIGYLVIVTAAAAIPRPALRAVIVALIALFALAPPLVSQDVLSYISYARLGAEHGLNPYESVPADVPGDPAFPYVGWRDVTSAYGPLYTLATYPTGLMSVPAALWTHKVTAAISVLALAALVARLARERGVEPSSAAAFVALNPLVLVHVVGGAHNDGLLMLVVMGAVALLLAGRELASGGAVAAAVAVKASAAFVAPFALLGSRRRLSFLTGAAVGVALAAVLTFAVFGTAAFDSVGLVGQNQEAMSRYSIPRTLYRILGLDADLLRYGALVIYALAVLGLLVWTARGGDWVRAAGWAGFGLLLATSWLMPWYVIWVLPFAAVTPNASLRIAVLALCAFQLVNRIPL
jgi:hypothetical protein